MKRIENQKKAIKSKYNLNILSIIIFITCIATIAILLYYYKH